MEKPKVRISVRNLVEFILRSGDLDNSRGSSGDKEAMLKGGRLHRKIQRSMKGNYQAEVSLKRESEYEDTIIQVEGRADGIFTEDGEVWIDEIKGTYGNLQAMEMPVPVHRAQAMCYGWIYGEKEGLSQIGIQMTYSHLDTEDTRRFREIFSMEELKKWYQELLDAYHKWIAYSLSWKKERNASMKDLQFPFPYREGQREIVSGVYHTVSSKKTLFVQAPTGVGKTELSKALAEAVFGSEQAMIRVDMSEYMEKHSVSKMIGSPPGYVGYEEGGQLSEKVRRNPYSVILFDEIEKAHPDVFNILLQVLDDGHITDAQGRKVDFKQTIIIMTSNAGAQMIMEPKHLGFMSGDTEKQNYDRMKSGVMEEVRRMFKPEFLNRIDEIMVFHSLNKENIRKIVTILLKNLEKRCQEQLDIILKVTGAAKDLIADAGFDSKYGARPLRRAIQTKIEDEMATEILEGRIKAGDTVQVKVKDKKIYFEVKDAEKA